VGYGDINPSNDSERLYCMFSMWVGAAFFGYMVGNISCIIADYDKSGTLCESTDK
jgi:Ion channel.